MNTTQLKRFATEARKILLQGVAHRIEGLGFDLKTGEPTEKPQLLGGGAVFMGTVVSESFYNRWMSLFDSIRHRGVRDVAEEAAYTWFNRLIAIRILSKQGFISPVLQYESEDIHIPLIVSEARHGRMPEMNERTRKELDELLNDDSKTNEQFALLIVAFCHSDPIINRCFGAITDYTELLLPQDILREGGYVDMLNHTAFISEEDYGSSTLIGWLYQFYISDRKDEVFAKKGKYDADEIAPATQIFTPEWIVEYMVQNTIGRIYLDNNPYAADDFKQKWKYLVDQAQRDDDHICHFDNLEELRFADLGCGSGHIVGYMFEVLFDLYLYEGYSRREAVEHILKENLTGVDIDQRAKQLATFALLLKACQKDKSFTDAKVMPNILDMPDPFTDDKANEDNIIREQCSHFILGSDTTVLNELVEAVKLMDNAKTLGSIMKFNISERTRNILQVRLEDYKQQDIIPDDIKKMMPYARLILALTQKYTALVMNPPYMGSGKFNNVLSKYVKDNYSKGKADLFAVFMLVAKDRLVPNGKYAMINMQSWMFLSSFEQLRKDLLETMQIDSMLHLGPHTFDELSGEVVQNTAFVVRNINDTDESECSGTYYRLLDGKNCADKERMFLENRDGNVDGAKVYYPNVKQKDFEKIPNFRFGYTMSQIALEAYKYKTLEDIADPKAGLATGDNNIFQRYWHEINVRRIGFNYTDVQETTDKKYKWFPCNTGGNIRKWGCNNTLVVNWYNNGEDLKNFRNKNGKLASRPQNTQYYFKEGLTWNKISSSVLAVKYKRTGAIFDDTSRSAFVQDKKELAPLIGILCSKVALLYLKTLNPTMSFTNGDLAKIPINEDIFNHNIVNYVSENVNISEVDWDAHETSWDFKENPLVTIMRTAEGRSVGVLVDEAPNDDCDAGRVASYDISQQQRKSNGRQPIVERSSANRTTTVSQSPDGRQPSSLQHDDDTITSFSERYEAAMTSLEELCQGSSDDVVMHGCTLEAYVRAFEALWERRFMQLHANEEELNRQFIDIYGLQDELTPDVPLSEITILQQGEITIE